jgi:enoyl-CoA hydratase/carnithine racemase
MSNEILLDKRADGIAVLTLNRPEAMNSINRAMTQALRAAIANVEADESVDVIVIAASGDRAFSTGIDLKERQTLSDSEAAAFRSGELFPMYRELDGRGKPAVAAVFGHTLAGGFELALSCDIIVAAEGASFGLPEVKWGLIPAAGGCRKLPALIGAARARDMILKEITGNMQSAVRGAKRAIDDGVNAWAACRFDIEVANACYASKERKSGIATFGSSH